MIASELRFERDGAEIISGAVSVSEIAAVAGAFDLTDDARPGRRSFADEPAVGHIVGPLGALGKVAQRLSAPAETMRPVRIVLFDKTPHSNWGVPWHQDRTIAVAQRCETPGFENWNRKDGVDHVEPPAALLSRMLTLRLHLDDAGADNGPLDILPGSHRMGRISGPDVLKLAGAASPVACVAGAGDILAMRLTTVHRSGRAAAPSRRRILHVDYSPDTLPAPLRWAIGQLPIAQGDASQDQRQ